MTAGPSSRKGGKNGNLARRMREKEADQKKEEPTDDGGPIQSSARTVGREVT